MTETLIILAGGASSRMKKSKDLSLSKEEAVQANSRSKALILLNDRPMLDYVLFNAKQAGIKNVIIVISPEGSLFKEYYGPKDIENNFHGLQISYATQHIPADRKKPLGTADALLQALDQYSYLKQQEFLVCNSDNLYSTAVLKMLRTSTSSNAFIAYDRDFLKYPMERIARFALTKIDTKGYLKTIIEKPETGAIEHFKGGDGRYRVSMNIFTFNGAQFYNYLKTCAIHSVRGEKELPTALLNMIADNPSAVKAIPMAEHVPDLTGKSDIKAMNDYLSHHIPKLDWDKTPDSL